MGHGLPLAIRSISATRALLCPAGLRETRRNVPTSMLGLDALIQAVIDAGQYNLKPEMPTCFSLSRRDRVAVSRLSATATIGCQSLVLYYIPQIIVYRNNCSFWSGSASRYAYRLDFDRSGAN
jgi:hypothetical protein